MRQLTKESFALKINVDGSEYIEMTYNKSTKKSQGDDNNEMNEQPILLHQESRRCPVTSFKFYLLKLTYLKDLFQAPNPHFSNSRDAWYKRSPIIENSIGKFMKEISKNAGLSVSTQTTASEEQP